MNRIMQEEKKKKVLIAIVDSAMEWKLFILSEILKTVKSFLTPEHNAIVAICRPDLLRCQCQNLAYVFIMRYEQLTSRSHKKHELAIMVCVILDPNVYTGTQKMLLMEEKHGGKDGGKAVKKKISKIQSLHWGRFRCRMSKNQNSETLLEGTRHPWKHGKTQMRRTSKKHVKRSNLSPGTTAGEVGTMI